MTDLSDLFATVQSAVHADGDHIIKCLLKTCEEMLLDRGCSRVCRAEDIHSQATDPLPKAVLSGHAEDGSGYEIFLCAEGDRVGVRYARAVLERPGDLQPVIVSVLGPTSFTRRECASIQFFTAKELCYNVTRHALVPKHTPISSTDMDASVLPKISKSDPVVRYYDWRCGTIVHIHRTFGGFEPYPYFRVVA